MTNSLLARLEEAHRRVRKAAERAGRVPSEVRVVAVSKTVEPAAILEAYRWGQREFGENRVQDFREKRCLVDALGPMEGARWHMVGHLQSNKAKPAAELFDIIQSVDSVELARLLDRHSAALDRKLSVLLQVDFTAGHQRFGFDPSELELAAGELVLLPNLKLRGLMTVAPLGLKEEGLRNVFRELRLQRDRLARRYPQAEWRDLSMGMSDDFELAIEEGATIVRIGRAIFGERPR